MTAGRGVFAIRGVWRACALWVAWVLLGGMLWGTAAPPAPAQVSERRPALSAEEAYRLRRSGVFLTVEGRVSRVLQDDREGAPHQRFILRLDSGLTLLVSHNTAVAPRAPVRLGDRLRVRGEYRWNAKGGVLHFTHRPAGRSPGRPGAGPGGWILAPGGQVYR